jgi:6-phosphofructokinase 1
MKKIGVMTTGGDCSGLNSVIYRIICGAEKRNWAVYGILDGTDGLVGNSPNIIRLDKNVLPPEQAFIAGSFLRNGNVGQNNNFEKAVQTNKVQEFDRKLKKSLAQTNLDALILIGGNGSLSLAWKNRGIYSDMQLICIPKTIDMDIPLTDKTIGFDTAVAQLTHFCDDLMLTARSHHRWFVVQSMGRHCGALALTAGVTGGASAILIPEIKFDIDKLVKHIKSADTDYGIIMVSEGISLRGHSGRPADMISRKLTAAGIVNRTAFPEHMQRAGNTVPTDRLLAIQMADAALNAIANNETYVMTALQNGEITTVGINDVVMAGCAEKDPNIENLIISNATVDDDNPLLVAADNMGIYIGETK